MHIVEDSLLEYSAATTRLYTEVGMASTAPDMKQSSCSICIFVCMFLILWYCALQLQFAAAFPALLMGLENLYEAMHNPVLIKFVHS